MKNWIFIGLSSLIVSCSSGRKIQTDSTSTSIGKNDVFSRLHPKASQSIFVLLDDDTLTLQEQMKYVAEIMPSKTNLHFFPKFAYQNIVEQNGYDSPELRKSQFMEQYFALRKTGVIDSSLDVSVLGIGEGSIVAPQLAMNLRAQEMILINPQVFAMGYEFTSIYTEQDQAFAFFSQYEGLKTQQDWINFFEWAEKGLHNDFSPTIKPVRYYHLYWTYEPLPYIKRFTGEKKVIQFSTYKKNSKRNHQEIKKMRANYTLISGTMFTSDVKKELQSVLR